MNKNYPMIETQNPAVLKVMTWMEKCTSLHDGNLRSIFKNLTCANRNKCDSCSERFLPKEGRAGLAETDATVR